MKSLQVSEGREIPLEPWCLMGIVNATPDSFSDGGRHLDPALAVSAALQMVEEGATIIDVGGESTRPGADRIAANGDTANKISSLEAEKASNHRLTGEDPGDQSPYHHPRENWPFHRGVRPF